MRDFNKEIRSKQIEIINILSILKIYYTKRKTKIPTIITKYNFSLNFKLKKIASINHLLSILY